MTVRDLIEMLQELNIPTAEVMTFSADEGKVVSVTGVLYTKRTAELVTYVD